MNRKTFRKVGKKDLISGSRKTQNSNIQSVTNISVIQNLLRFIYCSLTRPCELILVLPLVSKIVWNNIPFVRNTFAGRGHLPYASCNETNDAFRKGKVLTVKSTRNEDSITVQGAQQKALDVANGFLYCTLRGDTALVVTKPERVFTLQLPLVLIILKFLYTFQRYEILRHRLNEFKKKSLRFQQFSNTATFSPNCFLQLTKAARLSFYTENKIIICKQ